MTKPLHFRHSFYASLLILLVLILFSFIFCPNFVTGFDIFFMLKQISHIALMACGATIIIMLGHINVAYGSVMALTGCVACRVMIPDGKCLCSSRLCRINRDDHRIFHGTDHHAI